MNPSGFYVDPVPSRLAVVAELERYLYFSLLFLKVNI